MPFPVSPNPGDSYTDAYGTVWIYAGSVNGWYRQTVTPSNETSYTAGLITTDKIIDNTIINADVASNAAIAGTKISPNFGSQTIQTTGVFSHALGTAGAPTITFTGNTDTGIYSPGADQLALSTNATERARIDSSGRLLVGTASARTAAGVQGKIQVETNDFVGLSVIHNASNTGGGNIVLGKSRGSSPGGVTIPLNGDFLGTINFVGADGADLDSVGATISAQVDGGISVTAGSFVVGRRYRIATVGTTDFTLIGASANTVGVIFQATGVGTGTGTATTEPYANSMPGRIVLSTTADGAASPTERMRITQAGYLKATNANTYVSTTGTFHEHYQSAANASNTDFFCSSTTYSNVAVQVAVDRAATSFYGFFRGWSSGYTDAEFILRGDGNGLCDGAWTGGGADYAEYFEWSDSNPDADDRRGISVVLDGDKIREAQAGEDPIGVISGNPSVVGDAAWNKWSGKYLRDEFGTYIQEDYEVTDDDGTTVIQQRRKLNPAYDPDVEYVSREERPEWDCVGLMGKLRIRKGQVTGSRWIKMRDISDSVEEWLVR